MVSFKLVLSKPQRLIGLVSHIDVGCSASILEVYAKARKRYDPLFEAIAVQLSEHTESLTPNQLLSAVYGLGKFHFQDEDGKVFGILSSQVRKQIYNFSLDDCAQILSSLSRVKYKNPALISRVQERIINEGLDACSTRSVVNLMVSLTRFGVGSSRKVDSWPLLADTLAKRIEEHPESVTCTDVLAAIVAYSYSHVGRAHEDLFGAASRFLSCQSGILSLNDVTRYVKAASRCQYRDLETLSFCASCVRGDMEGLENIEKSALLDLYSGLEKLGVEIKQVTAELSRRGIDVPTSTDPTWFRQPAPRPVSKQKLKDSKSLRRRKRTW